MIKKQKKRVLPKINSNRCQYRDTKTNKKCPRKADSRYNNYPVCNEHLQQYRSGEDRDELDQGFVRYVVV